MHDNDLDWLARNVHKWVPNELLKMKPCDNGNGTFRASWCYSGDGGFTKDQWLARRTELQNKPSWDKAEGWAEWLAQDFYGRWGFFQEKPQIHALSWIARSGYYQVLYPGNLLLGDWRDTLERRPEPVKQFTSIEDNQEISVINQNNDWFKHGELPPVGVECEVLWGDGDWYETKVLAHHYINSSNICPVFTTKWDAEIYVACMPCYKFRPIRTEREKAISEMMGLAAENWGNLQDFCERLFEAGYRKESK